MALTQSQAEETAKDAVKSVIERWITDQKFAIYEVNKNLPKLATAPAIFKKAAFVGMGMSAAKVLFPNSALVQGVARLNVPITLASIGTELYKKEYAKQADRSNAILQGDYNKLRDSFGEELNKVATNFGESKIGVVAYDAMRKIANQRAKDFNSTNELDSYCQNVIQHQTHGLITEKIADINQRTQAGYGALCERIYKVYLGSHLRPGGASLIRLDPSSQVNYVNIFSHKNPKSGMKLYDPMCDCKVSRGPARYVVSHHSGVNKTAFAQLLSEIWRLEVKHIDNWIKDDITYVWPISEPPKVNQIITGLDQSNFTEVASNLQKADQDLWQRQRRA